MLRKFILISLSLLLTLQLAQAGSESFENSKEENIEWLCCETNRSTRTVITRPLTRPATVIRTHTTICRAYVAPASPNTHHLPVPLYLRHRTLII